MSKSKNTYQDPGFGNFMLPILEILSFLFIKGIELLGKLITYGIERAFEGKVYKAPKKIERKDLSKKKTTTDFDSIGYSVTSKRDIKGSDINKSKHSVVVGASGSGKSVLLDSLMFDDMRDGKPLVYLDPKGDNESLERFIDLCRMNNREYLIFSEYYNKDNKVSLNPVLDGTVNHIADRVFKAFTWSEEYYANKSHQALKRAVKSLKDQSKAISLASIHDELILLCNTTDKSKKINMKDIEGLLTKLENIVDSDFASSLFSNDGYSFSQLRAEGKCVYIGLSVLGYAETARAIGKLILGDINYSVYDTYRNITYRSKEQMQPLALYIDELSALITDEFIELLNKCRGAKVEVTSAFQTSSDINKVSPDLCQQVFENSLNWYVMKQRMPSAAEELATSIGTLETDKKTLRYEDGQEQSVGSTRRVEELIVHPNLIKNLSVGQCILLRQQPTRIDLMNVKYIDQATINRNIDFYEYNSWIPKRCIKDKSNVDLSHSQIGEWK